RRSGQRRRGLSDLIAAGRDGTAGNRVAGVARERRQVGRHLERDALAGALVIDLVALQERTGGERCADRQHSESSKLLHLIPLTDLIVSVRPTGPTHEVLLRPPQRARRPMASSAGAASGRTGPCGPWPTSAESGWPR